MNSEIFSEELNQIETDQMRWYVREMLETAPAYIAVIPASTSGKYHSAQQCETGGQVVHIKLACAIMNYILELEYVKKLTSAQRRDNLRAAMLFHDCYKCGVYNSDKTVHEHPILAAKWIKTTKVHHDISIRNKNIIAGLVASHMGQWNTSKYSDVKLPKPITIDQFLVHLCDYIGSRKNIQINFE